MQTVELTSQFQESVDRVVTVIKNNDDAIHNAVARSFGISSWFRAYTQSEDFAKLKKESKAEAFDTYENLKYALTEIESEIDSLNRVA